MLKFLLYHFVLGIRLRVQTWRWHVFHDEWQQSQSQICPPGGATDAIQEKTDRFFNMIDYVKILNPDLGTLCKMTSGTTSTSRSRVTETPSRASTASCCLTAGSRRWPTAWGQRPALWWVEAEARLRLSAVCNNHGPPPPYSLQYNCFKARLKFLP